MSQKNEKNGIVLPVDIDVAQRAGEMDFNLEDLGRDATEVFLENIYELRKVLKHILDGDISLANLFDAMDRSNEFCIQARFLHMMRTGANLDEDPAHGAMHDSAFIRAFETYARRGIFDLSFNQLMIIAESEITRMDIAGVGAFDRGVFVYESMCYLRHIPELLAALAETETDYSVFKQLLFLLKWNHEELYDSYFPEMWAKHCLTAFDYLHYCDKKFVSCFYGYRSLENPM